MQQKSLRRQKGDGLHCKAQPLEFPSLEAEKFIWQDFGSIPVLLTGSARKFITAQQFGRWLKGGEGGVRGGRNGGGEAVGPALPALGPALAGNCNSSSGGTVSSAWLPLASPECLLLYSRLYPRAFSSTQSSFVLILPLLLCLLCRKAARYLLNKQ